MSAVLFFAAIALVTAMPVGLLLLKWSFPAALLLSLGAFLLYQLIYILYLWLLAQRIPLDKPLEKQDPRITFGIGFLSGALNVYWGIRPIVTGAEKLPKDGRFLFICNHRSACDPIVVMDRLRDYHISFVSKPSNLHIPVLGRIVAAAGYLSIDRDNNRSALKTILTAADYMKRNVCSIGIYPEGTRSKTGDLLPFHAGSFKAAQRAGVPVAVASLSGSEKLRHFRFLAGNRVHLNIITVLPADTVCALRTEKLSEYTRDLILKDLEDQKAQVTP